MASQLYSDSYFKDQYQKLLVTNFNPAVLISVVMSECTRQSLKRNAQLNKIVKEHLLIAFATELSNNEIVEWVSETISECSQRLLQLILVNIATVVPIEASETIQPISDIFPQMLELLKANRATRITIKHSNHQSNSLGIERLPGTIGKGSLEFSGINMARPVLVDTSKDVTQPTIVRHLVVRFHGKVDE